MIYEWGPGELAVGVRVAVDTEPECAGEFMVHGIRPCMSGLVGVVVGIEDYGYFNHCFRVYNKSLPMHERPHHQWFRASELRPVKVNDD